MPATHQADEAHDVGVLGQVHEASNLLQDSLAERQEFYGLSGWTTTASKRCTVVARFTHGTQSAASWLFQHTCRVL